MKQRILLCLLALAAACGGLIPSTARAQEEVSFDFFYDSLRPYGDWIEVADYGLCWKPQSVNEEWAPYTDGYWSYTDGGWTWVSYEDFGGIVYHYGRWTEVEGEGWCWVPDYDWGPAWVSWRNDDEHVGWAPLPPEAKFTRETGVSTWVDTTYDIGPSHYHFCRVRDFGAPVIREVLLPPRENIVIIRRTVNVTNITYINEGIPFCGGPRYDFISTRVVQPVPTLKLVRETNIVNINNTVINNRVVYQGVQRGNTIAFPAPRIRPTANPLANPAIRPVRTVSNVRVNRGWNNVPQQERQAIKTKFEADTKGATPQTKKAVAPAPADLKPIPVKADPNAKNVVTRRPPGAGNRGGPNAGATPLPGTRPPGTPGAGPNGQPSTLPGATPVAGQGKGKGKAGAPNVGPNGQPLPNTAGEGKAGGRGQAPGIAPGEPNPNTPPTTGTATPAPGAGKGKGKAGAGGPNTRNLPGPSDAPPVPGTTPGETRPPGTAPGAGAGKGKGKAGAGAPTTRNLPGPSDAPPVPGTTPGETRPPGTAPEAGAGKGKGKAGAGAPNTRNLPGPSDAPAVPSTTPGESRAPGAGAGKGKGREGAGGPATRTQPAPSDEPSSPRRNPDARPKGANVPSRPPQGEAPVNRPPTTRPQPQSERPQPRPQSQADRPQPKPQPQAERAQPKPQAQSQPRPQAQPQPRPQVQQQPRPQVPQQPRPQAQQPQRAPQQMQRPSGAGQGRPLTDEEKKKRLQQQ